MNILQVSTGDRRGGANEVAWSLFRGFRARGHGSWLAVGKKESDDPDVREFRNHHPLATPWSSAARRAAWHLRSLGERFGPLRRAGDFVHALADPSALSEVRGWEDFSPPGVWRLSGLAPGAPDVVHCHNLHGGYFDLRALPWLSRRSPLVLTLHDPWLLAGHCGHFLQCERWRQACGRCPDLAIYPRIERDATRFNWRRKQRIFARTRLHVATPSRWLMRCVEESMLAPAVVESRVIHYGVDLSVFRPAMDRRTVRESLGIAPNARVLLFSASGITNNPFKDFETVRAAVSRVAARARGERILLLALGAVGSPLEIDTALVRFVPYELDRRRVAAYYQSADVYLHAARADNFPNVVLEALACGTPVVATAVCGIPEQVDDGRTGYLVPPRDSAAMAERVDRLLGDEALRRCMSDAARDAARARFDAERMVSDYVAWFAEICGR